MRSLLPEQGFVLDLKQAHQVGCDPFAMLDAMGPRLRHLHMLDWTASGELVLPGEGIMDFPRLFRRLAQMGYTGAAILEPYAIQGRDPQRLLRSLDYLRRQMEERRHERGASLSPVVDAACQVLVLGSFPSVKSREEGFFYGHPRNRFWPLVAALFGEAVPQSIPEKRALLRGTTSPCGT